MRLAGIRRPSPQGVLRLNGRELLFGEAKQLRSFVFLAYILSPLATVVAEKSAEEIDPARNRTFAALTVMGWVRTARTPPKGLLT